MLSQCFINELDIYLYMDYDMKVLTERRINMPIGIITDCLCVFIGGIPQFILYIILFICGGLIVPYTTPVMIDDFKAVGGIILLAIGFRMLRLKDFPTGDMIPALIIAMPVSYIWTNFIVPLL